MKSILVAVLGLLVCAGSVLAEPRLIPPISPWVVSSAGVQLRTSGSVVLLESGSSGAPSLAHRSSITTGLFFPSSSYIQIQAARFLVSDGSSPIVTYDFSGLWPSAAFNLGIAGFPWRDVRLSRNLYASGATTVGASGAGVIAIFEGTAPTTSPTDTIQLWSANIDGAGTNALFIRGEAGYVTTVGDRGVDLPAVTFATLAAPGNGRIIYCSDCDPPAAVATTCTAAGAQTGAIATRINGAWKCIP